MSEMRFAAGLLVLALLTVALLRWGRVSLGWAPLWALVRACVQLAVVAALLRGILTVPWTAVAFVLLMLATASLTAGSRIGELWHGRRLAVYGVLAGAAVSLGLVLALRLVPLDVRHLVAASGIVVGSTMSGATLAGRRFLHSARMQRDQIEGWLALGATAPQAHAEIARVAVREALLPNLDQTRATGLVTLPGAFVGALFGGASPIEAAKFQIVVLAAIALAMTVTSLVVTGLASRTPYVVGD